MPQFTVDKVARLVREAEEAGAPVEKLERLRQRLSELNGNVCYKKQENLYTKIVNHSDGVTDVYISTEPISPQDYKDIDFQKVKDISDDDSCGDNAGNTSHSAE